MDFRIKNVTSEPCGCYDSISSLFDTLKDCDNLESSLHEVLSDATYQNCKKYWNIGVRTALAFGRNNREATLHSVDEAAALTLYTMIVPGRESDSLSSMINKTLLGYDRSNRIRPFIKYIYLLLNALKNLPVYDSPLPVFRACGNDLDVSKYKLGSEVCWYQFSSCTSSKESLRNILIQVDIKYLFQIDLHEGRARIITSFSTNSIEPEILLPPNTRFLVRKIENEVELTTIHLQELECIDDLVDFKEQSTPLSNGPIAFAPSVNRKPSTEAIQSEQTKPLPTAAVPPLVMSNTRVDIKMPNDLPNNSSDGCVRVSSSDTPKHHLATTIPIPRVCSPVINKGKLARVLKLSGQFGCLSESEEDKNEKGAESEKRKRGGKQSRCEDENGNRVISASCSHKKRVENIDMEEKMIRESNAINMTKIDAEEEIDIEDDETVDRKLTLLRWARLKTRKINSTEFTFQDVTKKFFKWPEENVRIILEELVNDRKIEKISTPIKRKQLFRAVLPSTKDFDTIKQWVQEQSMSTFKESDVRIAFRTWLESKVETVLDVLVLERFILRHSRERVGRPEITYSLASDAVAHESVCTSISSAVAVAPRTDNVSVSKRPAVVNGSSSSSSKGYKRPKTMSHRETEAPTPPPLEVDNRIIKMRMHEVSIELYREQSVLDDSSNFKIPLLYVIQRLLISFSREDILNCINIVRGEPGNRVGEKPLVILKGEDLHITPPV